MELISTLLLWLILVLLVSLLVYLVVYSPHQKQQAHQLLTQNWANQTQLLQLSLEAFSRQHQETSQLQEQLLKTRLEQVEKGLRESQGQLSQQQKEIHERQEKLLQTHLESLSKQQKQSSTQQEQLLQLRLDSFSQELKTSKEALSQINHLLLTPFERGRLGNIQLDRLLSFYLPKDDKIYQLEYTLQKKDESGRGLRADAVIFGVDQKNNLAIDSKFPLDNYLAATKEDLSKSEKEEQAKTFKKNVKDHIKKVAKYLSEADDIKNVIMFIPSEVVFAKINEQSYYEIVEAALTEKVYLCSPVTLAIIVNQVLWTNKVLEQYRTMDQVLAKLQTFWKDFGRYQERWTKILKDWEKISKDLQDFNLTVKKIIAHGENIQQIKNIPQLEEETKVPVLQPSPPE